MVLRVLTDKKNQNGDFKMAKWFGKIGYGITAEKVPGVWVNEVVEKEYYGEVLDFKMLTQQTGDNVIDNIVIRNGLSIIADIFATSNLGNMLYAEFMGSKWKITEVKFQHPRIILTLGGLYNGEQA